jgi:Tol biopolymer transport system component
MSQLFDSGVCHRGGAVCATSHVRADFTFGEPQRVEPVIPNCLFFIDCFSSDGLEMYIYSARAGGQGSFDLWVLKRASVDEDWGLPQNLGPAVNRAQDDISSFVSADGLTLYFSSSRSGNHDIYMTTRDSRDAPWGQAVSLGAKVSSFSYEGDPSITPEGLELYFDCDRAGGSRNIWGSIARRWPATSSRCPRIQNRLG